MEYTQYFDMVTNYLKPMNRFICPNYFVHDSMRSLNSDVEIVLPYLSLSTIPSILSFPVDILKLFYLLYRQLISLLAFTSSRRRTGVLTGASCKSCGFSCASLSIFFIISINRSNVSLLSDSVGSIIMASWTINGKYTVGAWIP